MTMQTLEADIDLAQAEADLNALADSGDDASLRAALERITGGEATKVAATNGADTWVNLYHRYDGRTHKVPRYMVPKLLTARLQPDNDLYPKEVQRQQAWSLKAEDAGVLKAEYGPFDVTMGLPCYFSAAQADERILADRTAAGIPAFCRKRGKDGTPVKFSDMLTLSAHMKKHRTALPAFEKYRTERRDRERETQNAQQAETMAALAQALMARDAAPAAFVCDECGTESKSAAGLSAHKRSHA